MIRNILVLTDFSHDAYNALFYATQLYKRQKCTFHILHAYDRNSHFKEEFKGNKTSKKLKEFFSQRTAESLRETYHKIIADTDTKQKSLHSFKTVPKSNSLEKAMMAYLAKNPIDLVAMGNKGRTGLKTIFLGSNTINIIKSNINCPLLCVPKQIDFRPISQLGYITSFKHSVAESTLSFLKSLALYYKTALHVIHINKDDVLHTSQEKNKTSISTFFKDLCLRFHTVPEKNSKAKTISKFAKQHELDLLAMSYYPNHFLDRLFKEPVALDLSIYTETPLLILPIQA